MFPFRCSRSCALFQPSLRHNGEKSSDSFFPIIKSPQEIFFNDTATTEIYTLSLHDALPIYSCPLSRWCHPTISSSVVPFSSCLLSFPTSGPFPMSQLFASGGQSIGVSASTSVLPMNIQDWSPLGWTGWISLQSKGLSRVFSNTTVQKHQFFGTQLSL